MEEISAVRRGRGEKIVYDNSKYIRTSGGLTSYFLRGGGMDVFWNDPIRVLACISHRAHEYYMKRVIPRNIHTSRTDVLIHLPRNKFFGPSPL
jgi:hypothetical protein